MLYQHITELIGNTPLLRIDPAVHGLRNIDLYAKLEYYNPFGSLKDRIAWGIIKNDLDDIRRHGKTLIESSSGNTAKALQILSTIYGIGFETITNRVKVSEVKHIMQILGAVIEELPGLSECPDPSDPNDPLTFLHNRMNAHPDKYYHTAQYTNMRNPQAHYDGTGQEIAKDLGAVDYFIGGLGTAGSTVGVTRRLREDSPSLVTVGVLAPHGDTIPGIRNLDEMMEVGIFDKNTYDSQIIVSSVDAVDGMLSLNRRCGILGGPTSGAVYTGAIRFLSGFDTSLKDRKKAVFIACDRMEWYISYIKKRRPELFTEKIKPDTLHALTEQDVKSAPAISQEEAEGWIEQHQPLLIDVRSTSAFSAGQIKGSINIPDFLLEEIVTTGRPFPMDKRLLLVCPRGDASKKFAAFLSRKGYEAFSLDGGLMKWRARGRPLHSTLLTP